MKMFTRAFLLLSFGLAKAGAVAAISPVHTQESKEQSHLSGQWSFRKGTGEEKNFVFDKEHQIDLDKVAGEKGKCYDECIITNTFELKKEMILGFGAGADYWFEAELNGKIIFSTFPRGNAHFQNISPMNFRFPGVGKIGKNILKIRVRRGMASWKFCLEEKSPEECDPCLPLTITIDPNMIIGKIKPMNAVNNGPIKAGNQQTRGNFANFQKLEIPFARNHDASFCSSYGGEHTVDVNFIFPDFSKDPGDPASYDFSVTDRYLQTIQESGTKVFYRLGSKIEHGIKKYGTRVPPDFKKWAVICEHIIRHYNEGWANGFYMGIQYWEIWNEADLSSGQSNKPTWQGTDEEFFEFYRAAALHLKKCFPELKIGGPALASSLSWMEKFLSAMESSPRVPLDFFSWHFYESLPQIVTEKAGLIRGILDKHGYKNTESILDEWNYVRGWTDDFIYSIRQIIGLKGAVFNATMMSLCQDGPVDMLMYYDARPTVFNGLFDYYSFQPLKGYYAFEGWAKLARLGKQIKVDVKNKVGITATAAVDGKGHIGILINRYFDEDVLPEDLPIVLNLGKYDFYGTKLYLLDENNNLADVPCQMNQKGEIFFRMKANTLLYFEGCIRNIK